MRARSRKFIVSGEVTISVHTIVKADSKEEAIRLAEERGMMSLCHQCAGGEEDASEWVTSGELDGTPSATGVEEYNPMEEE